MEIPNWKALLFFWAYKPFRGYWVKAGNSPFFAHQQKCLPQKDYFYGDCILFLGRVIFRTPPDHHSWSIFECFSFLSPRFVSLVPNPVSTAPWQTAEIWFVRIHSAILPLRWRSPVILCFHTSLLKAWFFNMLWNCIFRPKITFELILYLYILCF